MNEETFYNTIIHSKEWELWEKEVYRRLEEHVEKNSKIMTGCWDVDESRELGLISTGHWNDFITFIKTHGRTKHKG